ncbi:MAG: serine/threonine-protein phosphatase, partial [Deltaproteobacteria bacterium]
MADRLTVANLDVAWMTDVGSVRENNEDAVEVTKLPEDSGVLIVVSDGMGGHAAGEVASRIVCDRMIEAAGELTPDRPRSERFAALLAALYDADHKVRAEAQKDPSRAGMGATVVAAAVTPKSALHLHTGDSRLYQFRGGKRIYRTQDHSLVEVLHQTGQITEAEMEEHPVRHLLFSSIGGGNDTIPVEVSPKWEEDAQEQEAELSLEPGDLLLLCSDGLNGVLGEDRLAELIHEHTTDSAEELVE